MSQVTLKIGPKSYTIACGPGEEAKITSLGAIIDEKYAALGAARAPLEAQNLVFAALFMADELTETRERAEFMADELTETRERAERAQAAANAAEAKLAEAEQGAGEAMGHAAQDVDQEQPGQEQPGQEQAVSGGKKDELRTEIEGLRKSEAQAREENAALKKQLADFEQQARNQRDLSGGGEDGTESGAAAAQAIAEIFEALAARAEQTAGALEDALVGPVDPA
jgi:cell division protein ZapA